MSKEIEKIDELLQVLDIECTCYKMTCDKCLAKHEIDRRLKAYNILRKRVDNLNVRLFELYNHYHTSLKD